jgi:hypothetical protein
MALVKCPDCGRENSDAAPACLVCGRPSSAATTIPTRVIASDGNRKYLFPALVNFVFPGFALGSFLKGHGMEGVEHIKYSWGVLAIACLVVWLLPYPVVFWPVGIVATVCFLISWETSVVNAYNNHEDHIVKVRREHPEVFGKKEAS